MKKVSVIIPTYNSEKFITKAVESVKAQKYANTEILVIDDGSSDNTPRIINELSNLHPEIKLFKNSRKKGPSGARNTGLLNATGEYIAFLDSDDVWLPDHLTEGINFLQKYLHIDVIFFNFKIIQYETQQHVINWFDEKKILLSLKTELFDDEYQIIKDDLFQALLKESFFHLTASVVRSKICKRLLFNENIMRTEDRDYGIRLLQEGSATFAFNKKITSIYYRHRSSLTAQNDVNKTLCLLKDKISLFSSYLKNEKTPLHIKKQLSSLIAESLYEYAYYLRKQGHIKEAMQHLLKSFQFKISLRPLTEIIKTLLSKSKNYA